MYIGKARRSIEIDIYILKRQLFTAKYMQYMLRWSDLRFGMFQACIFLRFEEKNTDSFNIEIQNLTLKVLQHLRSNGAQGHG